MKYRQGDVFLYQISSLPKGLTKCKDGVLKEGEVTGHFHKFTDPKTSVYENKKGDKFVVVAEPESTLKHPEHGAVEVKQGVYKVGLAQAYDYTTQMFAPVMD